MGRSELTKRRKKVFSLYKEIRKYVPEGVEAIQFRSDLAGLLVISMVSSYEATVKDILLAFADRYNCEVFSNHVERQYEKINSKIDINNLGKYLRLFDLDACDRFRKKMRNLKDAEIAYKQILQWRHEFAHAGNNLTTLEEALSFYIKARFVLYAFYDSLLI